MQAIPRETTEIDSRMLLLDERSLVSSPNVRASAILNTAHDNPASMDHPLREIARQVDLLTRLREMKPGRIVTVTHLAKDRDGAC
jgi:hypothetical protein